MTVIRPLAGQRLRLAPLAPHDYSALHPIFADPRAMRFMPTPPHATVDETRAQLHQESSRAGAYYWTIWRHGADQPLGLVNYLGETQVPGLGYIIHPDWWGQGIATEACRLALDFGFETLGLDRVELWIDEQNHASQRVAAKLGFLVKSRLPLKYAHRSENHTMLVFGRRAAEWRGEAVARTSVSFYRSEPVLLVRDVAAAAAFYRDQLGFQVDFLYGEPPVHGGVSRGDWSGGRVVVQLAAAPAERSSDPAGYLYIVVGSAIDQLYATYRDAGVDIVAPPQTYPWGMREFTVRDPDGQQLRFGTHA